MKRSLLLTTVVHLVIFMSIMVFVSSALAVDSYHGNVKSKIFHDADCRYFDCKSCVAVFENRDEAIEADYRPCKVCKP